jgi:hypothetical protein
MRRDAGRSRPLKSEEVTDQEDMVINRRPNFSRGNSHDGGQSEHDVKIGLVVIRPDKDPSCVGMKSPKTCATIKFSTMSDQVNCFEEVQDKLVLEEI